MRSYCCLVVTLALLAPRMGAAQEPPAPGPATLPEITPTTPAAQPAVQPDAAVAPSSAALLAGELEYGRLLIGFARPKGDEVRALFAFQGAYHPRSLANDAIYELLGRLDLVDKFRSRRIARYTLPIVGGVVATAGMFTGVAISSASLGRSQEEHMLIASGVMLAIGATMIFGSMFIGADPINNDEAKQLVDEYNGGLRRRLGLPPLEVLRAAPPISVAPVISPHGGGVAMALQF